MKFRPNPSGIPSFVPPEVLIFFHIPKSGGSTMNGILERCFPGSQHFNGHVATDSALLIRSADNIRHKYNALTPEQQRAVRCLMGVHPPMGIHRIFDRPAKYFSIVRHPVDRVISEFYYIRTQAHLPVYHRIKDMTLEEYLDSGIGIDASNHQVRMLSGCPELDAPWPADGDRIAAPAVEARHLEMAKQNIEDEFLAIAPLEEFTSLLVWLKRLYGWDTRHCLFRNRNVNADRPRLESVSEQTRRRLEDGNSHDLSLYEWVKARFASQIRALEPEFSRDRQRFELINSGIRRIGLVAPAPFRSAVARLVFS